jgi:hypothetical protein
MDALLTDLYYNQHLTSINALYPEAVQAAPPGLKITKVAVQQWMKNQTAQQQVKRQVIESKPVNSIRAGDFAIDLTILTQFKTVGVNRRRPPPNAAAVQLQNQQPVAVGIQLQPQQQQQQQGTDEDDEEEEAVGAPLRIQQASVLEPRARRPPRRNADEGYGSGIKLGGRLIQINGRNFNLNERYVNDEMSVIFTAIHIPTRFAYAYPMIGKSAGEAAQCAGYWLQDATRDGFVITHIAADMGREWDGEFGQWVRNNNIQLTKVVGGGPGLSVINSLHSHMKQWFLKQMIARDSVRWIDLIEPFLTMYNTKRKHSSLKLKDKDNHWVHYTPLEFKNSQLLQKRLYNDKRTETAEILASEHHWQVGDIMRVQTYIDRGYIKATTVPVFSKKTYPVLAIRGFQLQYPGENAGDAPRWIARKHAMWVATPSNSHTNRAVDDTRFTKLVEDNQAQRRYDAQQRLLAIG